MTERSAEADEGALMVMLDDIDVIDVDTHVTEPADLWTSRLPAKFRDVAPHVVWDDERQMERWRVGKYLLNSTGAHAHAGWKDFYPSVPPTLADTDPASWDGAARLKRMDEFGIHAQVIYPNLLGFRINAFLQLGDPELILECVRAYNDFQTDFCSADPKRLIPLMFLPFWDLDASMAEMKRCADNGHRGINFGTEFEKLGFPQLRSPHWHPLLAQAQDMDLPVSFHIGFSSKTEEDWTAYQTDEMLDVAKESALFILGNITGIAELIMSGMCERFPRLKFVSVESGFGYVPYLLEALDWQFMNMGGRRQHPDFTMPSEQFRRQIYATFWFETGVGRIIDQYPDNVMFESDFPHPTSLSPGPGSYASSAFDTIQANLADVPADTLRKLLHDNAAKLYKL
jgi:predicted TIM-barrel fold metal-dependent hydrolase